MSGGELPAGWEAAKIGDLCELVNGKAFKPSDWGLEGLPIIRIQNLNNPSAKFNYFGGEVPEKFLVKPGELLFAWSGTPGTSFGAHVWQGERGVLNQHIFRVLFDEESTDKEFFRLAINHKLDELIGKAQGGVGLRHVTKGTFEETEIVYPPLPEQRRIVEKIEALTARSRRAREALDALPALIDRYRQSILAAAFRGDLTAKDQGNNGRDLESGEGPYPIPQEWKWVAMQDLVSSGPQNGLYLPKNKYGAGHPILRIDNFQDYSSGAAVEFKKVDLSNSEQEVYGLSAGDIIINRVNAPSHLGKCMVVSERHVPAVFESNMMRLRVIDDVPARYVAYFLKSPAGRKALLSNAKWAVNQASINQGDVLATPVPLPADLGEMQEIVDCIESALAKIEAFGAGVESTFDRLSTLDQSILAKAFRGELVPQDPNDEPASVLLERIRAERAAAGEKPRRGRPRKAG